MIKLRLLDIKIQKTFAESVPSNMEIQECRENWNKYHKQDRYIVVNKNNELIDGYIQYLVLKENNIEMAEVKVSDRYKKRWQRKNYADWDAPLYRNQTTVYIFGTHINSKDKKERVWRVPNSWADWENGLSIGDKILVCTQYGLSSITVTKIKKLDKCPVDIKVRKVYRKLEVNKKGGVTNG